MPAGWPAVPKASAVSQCRRPAPPSRWQRLPSLGCCCRGFFSRLLAVAGARAVGATAEAVRGPGAPCQQPAGALLVWAAPGVQAPSLFQSLLVFKGALGMIPSAAHVSAEAGHGERINSCSFTCCAGFFLLSNHLIMKDFDSRLFLLTPVPWGQYSERAAVTESLRARAPRDF